MPRARSRALGKGSICRGPAPGALGEDRPSAKKRPSVKQIFAEGLALGKYGRMGHGGHWHQSLSSARRQALGKIFLFF